MVECTYPTFSQVLERQAKELGKTPEQLMAELRREAQALEAIRPTGLGDRTYEELQSDNEERRHNVSYPGPDCLEPDEVERYSEQGTLPDERLAHVQACSGCDTLLSIVKPIR